MARARNIKPGFFQNDDLAELNPLDRLAFIGMWTIADFKGCIEYRPKMLKVQLLPYDLCDMEQIAINLEKARFIRFYSVQGKRYIKIVNFEKHQNPHKNEKEAGSDIPDITEQDAIDNKNNELKQDGTKPDLIGTTRADSLLLIPSSLIPDSLNPIPESSQSASPPVAEVISLSPKDQNNPTQTVSIREAKTETELQVSCRKTWEAYARAYFDRYKTEPVRNAKVNGQVKQFVQRIGREESPGVAAYYLTHPDGFYVRKMHDFGLLLADAEKLRTEWATGRKVTGTRAKQIEQTGTMLDIVAEIQREREQA